MVKKAAKVIDRGVKQGRDGRKIGQRAVVELGRSWPRERRIAVLWTDGPLVYVLASSSLRHVLALERQVYDGEPRVRFRRLSGGKLEHQGVAVEVNNYKAQDDVLVQQIIQEYPSPSGSGQEMQKMIKRAASVIERGPQKGREGRPTEERAVLMLGGLPSGQAQATVVWTDGPNLYVLQSSSLRHVLAFEAQAYR